MTYRLAMEDLAAKHAMPDVVRQGRGATRLEDQRACCDRLAGAFEKIQRCRLTVADYRRLSTVSWLPECHGCARRRLECFGHFPEELALGHVVEHDALDLRAAAGALFHSGPLMPLTHTIRQWQRRREESGDHEQQAGWEPRTTSLAHS